LRGLGRVWLSHRGWDENRFTRFGGVARILVWPAYW
jgi:hypothetical protein